MESILAEHGVNNERVMTRVQKLILDLYGGGEEGEEQEGQPEAETAE
ncbi:MAG: hypothetical protein HUJ98_10365 [Bacteroidaceae bacterium]|nr:hypothetical protein [Bacteroidaceae bacterium]